MNIPKIVVCSLHDRSYPVLRASVKAYAPEAVIVHMTPGGTYVNEQYASPLSNNFGNFGDAYNAAINWTFDTFGEDAVIIANDDVVITPDTIPLLLEDVAHLEASYKDAATKALGFIGARSDFVLPAQNIRVQEPRDHITWLRWESERYTKATQVIAPIFAYLPLKAWLAAQFPPINWYSDNVICVDLYHAGFGHWVSRAYVHHAGSLTVGHDAAKLTAEAKAWIDVHRPQYSWWFR